MEKLYINNSIEDERLLNKKLGYVSKCRRQNKLLMKSISLKDCIDYNQENYILYFYMVNVYNCVFLFICFNFFLTVFLYT